MLPRVSVVKGEGADYLLFSNEDFISNVIFREGAFEPVLQGLTSIFCKGLAAPVVLDIGANLGAYSIPVAKALHAMAGRVYSFEPQRIVYYQLCGNIILNRLDNCIAYNQAVGEEEGIIQIQDMDYGHNHNIGAFSLNPEFRAHHNIESFVKPTSSTIPIIALDNFHPEGRPAFIKMDVEGYELNVMKGAALFLERYDFPPILFEAWNFDWFKQQKEALLSYFTQLGYVLHPVTATDYLAQHPRNPVQVEFSLGAGQEMRVTRIR